MHVKRLNHHIVHHFSSTAHSLPQDDVAAGLLGRECSHGLEERVSHTPCCQACKHEMAEQWEHHTVHPSCHAQAFGEVVQEHMHVHKDQPPQMSVEVHRSLCRH
jgi:hypothetical protein